MKNLFIINTHAGKTKKYENIIEQIEKIKPENTTIKYTASVGDATKIAKDFVTQCSDFVNVFVCGGDGTINEVINGIYDLENCALAPIPTGSGNDFIRSFEIPLEQYLNIKNFFDGKRQYIDLLNCNDRIGGNSVNIGFDCAVAKNVEKFKKWKLISSSFAYLLSIFYCLFTKRKHNFNVIADGKRLPMNTTYLLAVSAKGKYYGGGIKCAPLANNSDGYIDFVSIPTVSVPKFVSLLSCFIKGNHINNPKIDFVYHNKFKKIEYKATKPFEIGIDGEIFTVNSATIQILPKALQIILPNNN